MKRWNSISAATLMSVSAIALSACDESKVDAEIFSSLQQCTDASDLTREQCEQGYIEARSQHAEVSPKYTSKSDCEGEFGTGRCEQAPYQTRSGGSVFMPLMMGIIRV